MTGKVIEVFVDSANKSFYILLRDGAKSRKMSYLIVKKVNKKNETLTSKSAIEERIETFIIMLGANYVRIDKECKELINAIQNAVRDKNGNRKDDDTTNVDSLDSMEYSWKSKIGRILKMIEGLEVKDGKIDGACKV
jgi:hypothetical protein